MSIGRDIIETIELADLKVAMGAAPGVSLLVGAPSASWLQGGQIGLGLRAHYDATQVGWAETLTDFQASGDTGLYPGDGSTYEAVNGPWSAYVPWYVVWPGVNNTNTNAVIEVSQLNAYLLNSVDYTWQKLGAANGGQIATAQWMNTSTLAVTGSATAARLTGWPANCFTLNDGGTIRRLHGYGPRSDNTHPGAIAALVWGVKLRIMPPAGSSLNGTVEYYAVAGLDCYPKGLGLSTNPGDWNDGFGGNLIPLAGPGYIPNSGITKLHLLPTDGTRLRIAGAALSEGVAFTARSYVGARYAADSVYSAHPLFTQPLDPNII